MALAKKSDHRQKESIEFEFSRSKSDCDKYGITWCTYLSSYCFASPDFSTSSRGENFLSPLCSHDKRWTEKGTIMLRNIVALLILATVAADNCPKDCKCEENTANCVTTNLGPFSERIFKLKIANPTGPLIIENGPFNLTGLQDLNALSIESATILDIDETLFAGISKLTSFKLININMPRINNPLSFSEAKQLRILQISNTTLRKFETIKSNSLEELDLSGNQLTDVSKQSFVNLPKLGFINLENNNISKVDPDTFSHLSLLEDVLLSGNNITNLDPNIFFNNNLISLSLSNNPLKSFNLNLQPDLEKLVLKSCRLKTFSESLSKKLILLSYLDLSDNAINFSANAFANMEELEFVDLSNNNLTKLDPRVFYFNYKLQKIVLDNNHFSTFSKLENSRDFNTYYFSCKNCRIDHLTEDAFQHFSDLSTLVLSRNKLTGTDLAALKNLYNLIDLNLSNNNISVINPSVFSNCSGLQKINLSGNPLTTLNPNVFYSNRVLKTLDLSSCKLRNLWQQTAKRSLNSLVELNVADNLLASLSPRDLDVIPSIKVLGICNNNFHCDEGFRDSITWLIKHDVVSMFSPGWKTHENAIDSNKPAETVNSSSIWMVMGKDICLYEFYFDADDDIESDNYAKKYNPIDNLDDDDSNYLYDEEILYERQDTGSRTKYSLLWPTLVFIFTALSVLVVVANVLLLLLKTRALPTRVNLPRIKIPRWNTDNRLKKHSGSVYQPLSEEKPEIFISGKDSSFSNNLPKSAI
ncbi:hypothetical protein FQA39_LY15482 [Lamprigera yunnana]|nr:hypothetical protein FQA39_LY15482 [Lamprigera yunnana]